MEPAFRIATSLHKALTAAAHLFADTEVSPKNVFVRTDFAQDLAAKLVEATTDAAALHQTFGIPIQDVTTFVNESRERNYENIKAVHRDSESLLALDCGAAETRIQPEFVSTTDQFALDLLQSLSQIIDMNVATLEQHSLSPSPALRMSEPQFVQYLVTCLRQTVEAHVRQGTLYREARVAASQLQAECNELKEALTMQVSGLREEIARLQAEKTRAVSEREQQLQEQLKCAEERFASEIGRAKADHNEAFAVAQTAIERLAAEILAQQSAHQQSVDQTRQEANLNRMRADSEETERKRLASVNEDLERQIKELHSRLEEQAQAQIHQMPGKRKDAETQTLLTIRVPGMQTPARNSGPAGAASASSLKRSHHVSADDGNGETATTPRFQEAYSAISKRTAPPRRRAAELAALPVIAVDLSSSDGVPAAFTRPLLKAILGGNVLKGLAIRVANPPPLASQYNIETYLCATHSRYPWLPTQPGKHGFLPYDVDIRTNPAEEQEGTKHKYRAGEVDTPCHVFVGTGGSGEVFHYYGRYRLTKVNLTKEEWALLPESAKTIYVDKRSTQLGIDKGKRDLREKYDDGTFAAPCVRLECIEFDAIFYEKLVENLTELLQNPEVPSADQHDLEDTPSKRRRVLGRQVDPIPYISPGAISPHNIDDMYA